MNLISDRDMEDLRTSASNDNDLDQMISLEEIEVEYSVLSRLPNDDAPRNGEGSETVDATDIAYRCLWLYRFNEPVAISLRSPDVSPVLTAPKRTDQPLQGNPSRGRVLALRSRYVVPLQGQPDTDGGDEG